MLFRSPPSRVSLSWWSLLEMLPQLPADVTAWTPASELLPAQGLALLHAPRRYASLECGPWGGGHGHRDRLSLTLHADGVYWLPDVGTGSYVSRELFWYRETLAHNAPRLDGRSQPVGDAICEAFDARDCWAWARGRYGEAARALVAGPGYLVDVVDLASREEHVLELPWHFAGEVVVEAPGEWEGGELADEFVTVAERFVPEDLGPVVLECALGERRLRAHLAFGGELLRVEGPGRPGGPRRDTFYVVRVRGRGARLVTVLESVTDAPQVRALRVKGDVIEVDTPRGIDRHAVLAAGWSVDGPSGGARPSSSGRSSAR